MMSQVSTGHLIPGNVFTAYVFSYYYMTYSKIIFHWNLNFAYDKFAQFEFHILLYFYVLEIYKDGLYDGNSKIKIRLYLVP